MASCDKELNTLPVLATCPTGVEYVLLIGVPSLINGDNLGGYGLIRWSTILSCLAIQKPIQFTVGSGGLYVPNDGDTAYNNPTLAGDNRYLIYRSDIADDMVEFADYTYLSTGGFQQIGIYSRFDLGTRYTLTFY